MSVDPATFDKLCQIEDKLVPVSVVGLYRTGKSYLLNKFAGKKSGMYIVRFSFNTNFCFPCDNSFSARN